MKTEETLTSHSKCVPGLVAGVLAYKCGPVFAALTGGTLALYTLFTFSFTQVRFIDQSSLNSCRNGPSLHGCSIVYLLVVRMSATLVVINPGMEMLCL